MQSNEITDSRLAEMIAEQNRWLAESERIDRRNNLIALINTPERSEFAPTFSGPTKNMRSRTPGRRRPWRRFVATTLRTLIIASFRMVHYGPLRR